MALFIIIVLSSLPALATRVQAQKAPPYVSPFSGSTLVSPGTTIGFRPGDLIVPNSISNDTFHVNGTQSGLHSGRAVLADDQRTVIFKPDEPFLLGENVTVVVAPGLLSTLGQTLAGTSIAFQIAPHPAPAIPKSINEIPEQPLGGSKPPMIVENATNTFSSTLPVGFPYYTVNVAANGTADGDLFIAPFFVAGSGLYPYLLVLDNSGQLIFHKQLPLDTNLTDFKRLQNGQLAYFDGNAGHYIVLDSSYNVVDSYRVGNGYPTDVHDLQILPNNHALLMSYDAQTMDLSTVINGANSSATVVGLIVQELDASRNVVFQWRSWDHFNITDTTEAVTGTVVDYVHGNAIELDSDGNLLLSSRHLDEITKIDRQTGNVIWRWGGKNNQFTFVNDSRGFAHQHDIRRLTNGNVTLWDNHNGGAPLYSRGLEYTLDEVNKTATLVWEYRDSPDAFSPFMGNTQRLPNGNTITGWGGSNPPAVIEVKPDGSKAFELSLPAPYFSYRAFRFPWHGYPTVPPTLVAQVQNLTTTLAYSWNGATEIASYKIYGGDAPYPTDLIATQPKTGFEDHTVLVNEHRYCYFRVMPVDNLGNDTRYSNEVYTRQACYNGKLFFPFVMN